MRRYRPTYFLGQAFKGLWRNGMMTLASVTVLLSCLVVMGCFAMLVVNINENLASLGQLNEIFAFVDADVTYEPGQTISVSPAIKSQDKLFLGWSTDPDATAPTIPAGTKLTVESEQSVAGVITLYAIWQNPTPYENYTVSYHTSGIAIKGSLPTDEGVYHPGDVLTVPSALLSKDSTVEFLGWTANLATVGTDEAEIVDPGEQYVVSTDDIRGGKVTLYAVWSKMPVFTSFSVVYDSNGVEVDKLPTDDELRVEVLRRQLENLDGIAKDGVTFVSNEETLENEKENLKDYPGILATLEQGYNPYPHTFILTYEEGASVSALQLKLEHIDGIYNVRFRADIAENIEHLKNGIILIFTWFMAILFVVSIFVIINTVKLAVVYRSKEITIMRYVGATKWFIALPFELEGIIIGLFSGIVAFLLQWYAYGYIQKMVLSELQMISIVPFTEIRPLLLIGCLVIGVMTGLIGSIISIRKYLKA